MSDTKETIGFYQVSYPVKRKGQKKTWWLRVGSATLRSDGSVIGSIVAAPLNWDGSFYLFPVEPEPEQAEIN